MRTISFQPLTGARISNTLGRLRRQRTPFLFIAPAFIFYSLIIVYPVLYTFTLSFYRWTGFGEPWSPVGFENFQSLLDDRIFGVALRNTLIYVTLHTFFVVTLGLFLALLVSSVAKGQGFFRTVYFLPVVLALVLVSLLWRNLFQPTSGLINELLTALGLGSWTQVWLGSDLGIFSITFVAIWQGMGAAMVFFLAGIQSIPQEVLEAARIDGATESDVIRWVILPLLWPVTIVVTVLMIVSGFKVFDYVYIMTQGGPAHSTEVLTTYLYFQAFQFNKMGYASAIGVFLTVLAVLVGALQLRLLLRSEEY